MIRIILLAIASALLIWRVIVKYKLRHRHGISQTEEEIAHMQLMTYGLWAIIFISILIVKILEYHRN
jgi:hypothetical protein